MGFDNRMFKVNGEGLEDLKTALSLVFKQQGYNSKAKGWSVSPEHGFVLYWYKENHSGVPGINEKIHALPGLNSELSAQMIWDWLQDKDTWKNNKYDSWECDADHDGSNKVGWLVYCGEWGHVGHSHASICAVKPCYLWLGK
jgi:hypothetical protein